MEASVLIGIVSIVITIVAFFCSGVWAVATVKTTVFHLSKNVDALGKSIEKLAEKNEKEFVQTQKRLDKIESNEGLYKKKMRIRNPER